MTAVDPNATAGVRLLWFLPVTFFDKRAAAHAPGLHRRKPVRAVHQDLAQAFAWAAAVNGAGRLRSQATQ